jgi:proline iminopeptidase
LNALRELYPVIEPYQTGVLEVSGGHHLSYEVCGNPNGLPAVFLHGGPGAGCEADHRRFFDPSFYRIVLFDQRGAGRSIPSASIENNTTAYLVDDIETLRRRLEVDQWLVFGGSWGSTLALAYAAAHPHTCLGLILRGIWICRPVDLRWQFYDARRVFPEHWQLFAEHVPPAERDDLLGAYWKRLNDPDPAVHLPAANRWAAYESNCLSLLPSVQAKMPTHTNMLAMARIEAHYMRNRAFLRQGQLLQGISRFRSVPGVIVHGRYDMLCPVDGAFTLAKAWPEARFSIVPNAGHAVTEPGILSQLVEATDRFRDSGRL